MPEHTQQPNAETAQAQPNGDQTRLTVSQAARQLGLSAEAVRSRVQRGTLKSTKVDGTVYVLLDETAQNRPNTDESRDQTDAQTSTQTRPSSDQTEFIASLQGQIDWLRREVERKDTLLMSLMQRIPELEAPREDSPSATRAPVTPSEGGNGYAPAADTEEPRRSWWGRFFFGP
jgi:hypothetical protein